MEVHAHINPRCSREVANRAFDGIPAVYSLGNCHQLPPVGETPLYALVAPNNLFLSKAFQAFLDPTQMMVPLALPLS
jgi:hypothetical protein